MVYPCRLCMACQDVHNNIFAVIVSELSCFYPMSPSPYCASLFFAGGEWVMSGEDCECLAIGAGIMGCGGGGDPNLGRVLAQKMLKEGKDIRIINPMR